MITPSRTWRLENQPNTYVKDTALIFISQDDNIRQSKVDYFEEPAGISIPHSSVQQLPKYFDPGQTSVDLSLCISNANSFADRVPSKLSRRCDSFMEVYHV